MEFHDIGMRPDTRAVSPAAEIAEKAGLEGELAELQKRLTACDENNVGERASLQLEVARNLSLLEKGEEAWPLARQALDHFIESEQWENAAEACNVLYLSDQPDSLAALGQGIWLAVTYPINPEVTIELLQQLIDDTPKDSDGAAVAAATAAFIADLRATEQPQRNDLIFFTQQMLGNVARRHSEVESQQQFDYWIEKLELNQPDKFLVRLRNIVDVLVQDNWWFDREELQSRIPEE
ncbi:MAG TPA: hypothetical protein EYP90_05495 [Chromatiaceae bacterium]|nr:hypothetical protein [Chromatiaceae bacterium]